MATLLQPKLLKGICCTLEVLWPLSGRAKQWSLQLPLSSTCCMCVCMSPTGNCPSGVVPAPITPQIEDKDLWRLEIICHADWTSSSMIGWHARDDHWLIMYLPTTSNWFVRFIVDWDSNIRPQLSISNLCDIVYTRGEVKHWFPQWQSKSYSHNAANPPRAPVGFGLALKLKSYCCVSRFLVKWASVTSLVEKRSGRLSETLTIILHHLFCFGPSLMGN